MASKRSQKPAKKRVARKKPAAARKKLAAKKKVATKRRATRQTAAAKGAKKAAKRGTRKAVKVRATRKTARGSRRTATNKTARRTATAMTRTPARIQAMPEPPEGVVPGSAARVRVPSPLSKRDLAQFRELLLAKRVELVGDVSTLQDEALSKNRQEAAGDLSNMPIHMADLGTDHYEQEFTLGLIESERALLREIDEALERIGKGTYGICQATGKPIGKARLRARPWAKYCYEYVLAQETGQDISGL